jgi:hypothetical protein
VAQDIAALTDLATRKSPLSAAQRSEVFTADAGLQGKREAALAKLAVRDDAQAAVAAAQAALDAKLLEKRIADATKTDEDLKANDQDVKDAADKLKKAQDDLLKADQDISADDNTVLQAWFAAMPDASWDELDALDAAYDELTTIAAIDPVNDLVNPMNAAEKNLAQNLDAAAQERRLDDRIDAELGARQAAVVEAREIATRRMAAAERFVMEV